MDQHSFKEPPLYQTSFEVDSGGSLLDGCADGRISTEGNLVVWAHRDKCKFCSSGLEILDARGMHGEDDEGTWFDVEQFVLGCLQCGWWRYEFSRGGETIRYVDVAIGSIFRVQDERSWAPVPILREYLTRHPDYLRADLDPIDLEQVMRDVFRDFYEVEVRWTGRGADGGFDLYHVIGDVTTVYQVKRRRSRAKSESVIPIRALLGTMLVRGAVEGIFVTTASRFSAPAKKEANLAAERGWKLELVDYGKLMDILRSTAPKNLRPYDALWQKNESVYQNFAASIVHPVTDSLCFSFPDLPTEGSDCN